MQGPTWWGRGVSLCAGKEGRKTKRVTDWIGHKYLPNISENIVINPPLSILNLKLKCVIRYMN